MSPEPGGIMLTIATWKPPFEPCSLGEFVPPERVQACTGQVLLARLSAPIGAERAESAVDLARTVASLRAAHPGCPTALWVHDAPPQLVIDTVRAACQAQVRAILGGDAPDPVTLRAQLTHPANLSTFVLRWASDAGYLPPGMEQEDVRELLDAAPNVRTLERLSLHRQVAARTWRSRLQQLGLPNPRAWLGLAHALHVAFFVQRNRTESLQSLSEQLGMLTVANMSQQFRRVFGLAPGQVRDLLGAEPLLHRWFQQKAGSRPPPLVAR